MCCAALWYQAALCLQDLGVIACIGETLAQRESGKMFDVLTRQLVAIGDNIAGETTEGATLVPPLHHLIAGQATEGHDQVSHPS